MNDTPRRPTKPPLAADPIDLARSRWCDEGWSEAADGMAVVTSIMRVQQVLLSRVEAILRPLGLTFARYEVLMLLRFSRAGSLPVGKIGERLQVHPASVTNAVDRLEGQGFVRRTPHPTDRRATLVELTETGRAVAAKATDELNASVFARPGLSADAVDQLVAVLTLMRAEAGESLPSVNPCEKTPQPRQSPTGRSMIPARLGPVELGNVTRSAMPEVYHAALPVCHVVTV